MSPAYPPGPYSRPCAVLRAASQRASWASTLAINEDACAATACRAPCSAHPRLHAGLIDRCRDRILLRFNGSRNPEPCLASAWSPIWSGSGCAASPMAESIRSATEEKKALNVSRSGFAFPAVVACFVGSRAEFKGRTQRGCTLRRNGKHRRRISISRDGNISLGPSAAEMRLPAAKLPLPPEVRRRARRHLCLNHL